MISAGIVKLLEKLINHSDASIIKETAWCFSNILGGTQSQIQTVIDCGVLNKIIDILFKVNMNWLEYLNFMLLISKVFEVSDCTNPIGT